MGRKPKPLFWIGSSRKDLLAMPDEVKDVFGFALYQAQTGSKSDAAKPLKGFGSAAVLEVVEDWKGSTYRAVYTVKFATSVYVLHCFQKKATRGIETPKPIWKRYASGFVLPKPMPQESVMREVLEGSTNVYSDLSFVEADAMLIKAQLAAKIGDIIKSRRLTQAQAAELLGMPQPKVSAMLRGQFRGISEDRMMRCLVALGQNVQIVVKPVRSGQEAAVTVAS